MLSVPKVHILYKGRDQDRHLRLMGYKQVEQPGDAKTGNAGLRWEATDDYASRMQGFMMFYGALSQSEQPRNPIDLAHAWRFVARSAGLARLFRPSITTRLYAYSAMCYLAHVSTMSTLLL